MIFSRLVLVSLLVGHAAAARALEAIPVPWVASDPSVPHLAYNGHATTFKAIARGGNGTYLVEWDFDGDGVYDLTFTSTDRYDLSARFTFPHQGADATFQARVRVTSNGEVATATYPVRVFTDVPANPAMANDHQLQVMRSVAIDDGLWFLHRQLTRAGNEEDPLTGAQVTGWVDLDAGQGGQRNWSPRLSSRRWGATSTSRPSPRPTSASCRIPRPTPRAGLEIPTPRTRRAW